MKKPTTKTLTRKPGDQRGETARKARRVDQNFAQSRDLHESRGTVQSHLGRRKGGSPKQGRNS